MNTSEADSDRLLTVEEAARYLGLTKSCLDQWRSRGNAELPYTRVGGRVRYPLQGLREYVKERTVSAR